ncbi:MAG: diguanylate cyclase [Thermoleophilia bacterium]
MTVSGERPAPARLRSCVPRAIRGAMGMASIATLAAGATVWHLPGPAVAVAAAAAAVAITGIPGRLRPGRGPRDPVPARDALTGLLTHRAFHERLAQAVARAEADRTALSLVEFDIDNFKAVNDAHTHLQGDRVLQEIARRIGSQARDGDLLGRVGGERFAWVLTGLDDGDAWAAAERVRLAVREQPIAGLRGITVSAGVCDLRQAHGVAELQKLAHGALYWAKVSGRDMVQRYSTQVQALSAEERASQLTRAQALSAMRVLARAVDARDPYTRQHSDRVADLAVQLATVLRWPVERIVALREAALVHDVGKIGVPDAVLLKEGPLAEDERRVIEEHPALGAQIVADVLSDEQTDWVRGHHERWDGRGYPDALKGTDIPDGARVMSVADAWDAMTTDRPYRKGLTTEEAAQRIRDGRGSQFDPVVADAMARLMEALAAEQAILRR